MKPERDFEQMVKEEHERLRAEPPRKNENAAAAEFSALGDDRYQLSLPAIGVTFEVDRLRRERNELIGELCVRCDLSGVRTVDGSLSIADFNLSSARARLERAKLLAERANTNYLDWLAWVEEFCQRVLQADRTGLPAVDLRTLPLPTAEDALQVEGLHLLRRHPTILFGDGGAAKSYLGMYVAGRLAERGMRVALFDWELAGEDHRERLERLFWDGMPQIFYARCERPLAYETDRLRRVVREHRIEYIVYGADESQSFSNAKELAKLTAEWPASRLVDRLLYEFGSIRKPEIIRRADLKDAEGIERLLLEFFSEVPRFYRHGATGGVLWVSP